MSVEYSVLVRDEVDAKLEQIREEDIKAALMQTLEDLAERDDQIQQQQDELHERMGVAPNKGDDEELSEEELKHEVQRFLRGERQRDPRINN
jgi:hypothetical protein